MNITDIRTCDLKPYENNPRLNEDAVDLVAASIDEFGFKQPIVVDKDLIIIAGHTRWKAAQKLGLETVPCIQADDLTPAQVKAYRLADNKVAEAAQWDLDALQFELEGLDNMGFDMEPFGFETETFNEQLGRRCFMMEYDPHYADVIIKRWEDYTGEQAELISDAC